MKKERKLPDMTVINGKETIVLPREEFLLAALARLRSGKIARVDFIKKNGEFRRLIGRTGVSKGVTGEGLKFNPSDRGMIVMFELDPNTGKTVRKDEKDKGFRFVTVSRIQEFAADNKVFRPESAW